MFINAGNILMRNHRESLSGTSLRLAVLSKYLYQCILFNKGARCSSVVRAFAHGAMGRRIDSSWGGPI